ncbi:hypothetical protein KOR42_24050 [Thalassoglobus neptunius]|uniref:Uncharacterized protein n=1 Tax=Thalassoglobus neptunius TaxID=1938619 RepID=A0A5C5X3L5_9PLAN|nr:hypothetical protein [Thalassoglobus neptunius]TWT56722.1 hypothetical protein KOR42_00760 [Thalassoglobus neptunius]TWT59017.1 hypothetical protein KOR42_24050 [Thalassoglobus neptunius]
MSEAIRKAYPSDLTDLQWEMIEMILFACEYGSTYLRPIRSDSFATSNNTFVRGESLITRF